MLNRGHLSVIYRGRKLKPFQEPPEGVVKAEKLLKMENH